MVELTSVPLIPRKTFFKNPDVLNPQLSPDGRWLSWLAAVDGVMNVWAAPRDDLAMARPLTRQTDRPILAHWFARTVAAMTAKSIPVISVVFPDEGHGLARPENNIAFNAIMEVSLARHVGGRFEPLGDDLTTSNCEIRVGASILREIEREALEHAP